MTQFPQWIFFTLLEGNERSLQKDESYEQSQLFHVSETRFRSKKGSSSKRKYQERSNSNQQGWKLTSFTQQTSNNSNNHGAEFTKSNFKKSQSEMHVCHV